MQRPHASDEIRIGVIGLGFMGRTHVAAIDSARRAGLPCRLVAVCDGDERRRRGESVAAGNLGGGAAERLFDPAAVRGFAEPEALLEDDGVDLVNICTWTDSHVPLALAALAAGKHVIVEKPVALQSAQVRRVAEAAAKSDRLCMPAMCMRWWPGWPWLRDAIRAGRYGPLRSASFTRIGPAPGWNDFYADESRSGGALFDLHVHDVDFIRWCFGAPSSLCAGGDARHLSASFRFAGGPLLVVAEGGWSLQPAAGFRMRYLACFEEATVEFDLARPGALLVHCGERTESIALEGRSGYEGEVMAAIAAIRSGVVEERAALPTMEDALAVTEILEAERASLRSGTAVELDGPHGRARSQEPAADAAERPHGALGRRTPPRAEPRGRA
ncbi:MAG TPA: Gfo/Idh/MocA family oxidoreductase [Phycisphaerales bacterium]|nr:Gfo/Idh/MocA family oxidoreductase [Phycisphaerales bacterium]HMP36578.1 Gfo/Idh/MocA family oxidoreductase [Phycisphaerales bacterium]